jgi:hypothetical protein
MAKQRRKPVVSMLTEAAGVPNRSQHSGSIRYIFRTAAKRLADIICNSDAQAARKVISQLQMTIWFPALLDERPSKCLVEIVIGCGFIL